MAGLTRKKHRKDERIKKRACPTDDCGYRQFIQSRSKRIQRLIGHLSEPANAQDYQSRRLLERLIDERGAGLSSPPETVNPELVEALKEEVRNG